MLESRYQAHIISRLEDLFDGCFIIKNDSAYRQGIPDLLILWRDRWAMLEVKAYEGAPEQPNQRYYVDLLDRMSYAAFICPENENEVLNEIQQAFSARRQTRVSQR